MSLSIAWATLHGLGHYELVKFDCTPESTGRRRWRFDTTTRAGDSV